MKKLNPKGFGVIEGLLIIVAIAMIAGIGFYVINANKEKKDDALTTTNSETGKNKDTSENKKPVVPDGFIEYSSKELGIKFAYPKNWGDVNVKKSEASSGEEQVISFSKNPFAKDDYANIVLQTPDFKSIYPTEGFQIGFTDYQKRKNEVEANDSQRKAGSKNYSTTILDTSSTYFVFADYDCLQGGYYIEAMSQLKNSKFAGFGVGYFESFKANDLSGYCNQPPDKPVSETVDKNIQKQLTDIIKTVEGL